MANFASVKEFLIPKWTVQDPSGLESFISELQSAKDMEVLSNDKMLIYAAMVKSGKSDIFGIKQEDNEDCVNFFLRTEKQYFRSKNMTKPRGKAFLQQYKEDIRFQYVQGLKDPEVKRLMVRRVNRNKAPFNF